MNLLLQEAFNRAADLPAEALAAHRAGPRRAPPTA